MPIAGVDEVGRGPLAGPVVAAAVILRAPVDGLADSKTLPAARREALAGELRAAGAVIALGAASVAEIDRLNILRASLLAMRRAVLRLALRPELILVDGHILPPDLPCAARAIIGGDATEPAIAAASIVAKVARDRLMCRLALRHAGYAWERNAGYPTPAHLAGLARLGATRHHRQSFRPVRETGAAMVEGEVSRPSGSGLHPLGADGGAA
ncbi:MAG TPA: ribonuclease HII [Geminicoccaceae bacterium]|nr:ribonuclease HII [Geminicoccaceae bacterium]